MKRLGKAFFGYHPQFCIDYLSTLSSSIARTPFKHAARDILQGATVGKEGVTIAETHVSVAVRPMTGVDGQGLRATSALGGSRTGTANSSRPLLSTDPTALLRQVQLVMTAAHDKLAIDADQTSSVAQKKEETELYQFMHSLHELLKPYDPSHIPSTYIDQVTEHAEEVAQEEAQKQISLLHQNLDGLKSNLHRTSVATDTKLKKRFLENRYVFNTVTINLTYLIY